MSPAYAKHCRYCRVALTLDQRPTMDHVIPKVVARWWRRLGRGPVTFNKVSCCAACNHDKGSMPVTVFLANRFDPEKLTQLRHEWQRIHIAVEIVILTDVAFRKHQLCKLLVAEFVKPIPPHFVTGTRAISVRYADAPAPDFVRGE